MKAIRFWMAMLVMLGLLLACLRHVRVVPSMLRAERSERGQVLRDNLFGYLHWVNLSGGFSRWALGHRRCNEVYISPNGMLVKLEERCDMAPIASNIIACAQALAPSACRNVYVQMPCKQSLDGQGVPAAFGEDSANENRDEILTLLRPVMRVVDLRPIVSATAEDVRNNFIRTDHHWNFEGAFRAFQHLVPVLLEECGVRVEGDLTPLDRANWKFVELPRKGARFLGTSARRTGTWFVGYDRLEYLVPTFRTDLVVSTVDRYGERRRVHGDFASTLLNERDMREPPTYVEDYGYNVYLGDMAYVEITNASAPVDKSVFVVKNSMSQPLLAWMSTVFARIVAVDPRYHKGVFSEDVRESRPDIVIHAFERSRLDYSR